MQYSRYRDVLSGARARRGRGRAEGARAKPRILLILRKVFNYRVQPKKSA